MSRIYILLNAAADDLKFQTWVEALLRRWRYWAVLGPPCSGRTLLRKDLVVFLLSLSSAGSVPCGRAAFALESIIQFICGHPPGNEHWRPR
jgi:hypothetical protein